MSKKEAIIFSIKIWKARTSMVVVRLGFCRGRGFDPWSGSYDPTCLRAKKKKKKKTQKQCCNKFNKDLKMVHMKKYLKNKIWRAEDFLGSPVVGTPHFHFQGVGLIPGWELRSNEGQKIWRATT